MPTCNCVSLEEVLPIMHYNIVYPQCTACWTLFVVDPGGISMDHLCDFADPFQVDHQLTPLGSTLSEVILAMSLQIFFKLTIDWPPGSTLSEAILARSSWILSKLTVDWPHPKDQHCQRGSSWILSKLTVDWPPSPPLPPHLQPSWVECWLTPLPSLPTYNLPKLNVDRPPLQTSTFESLI